jgi:arsenite methyltransferase
MYYHSNCVINLVPNKQRAYNECFRILKPGGRFAMSDIAFRKALPEPFANNIKYWTGCIAGAQGVDEMRAQLKAAGFSDIEIVDSDANLNVYKTDTTAADKPSSGTRSQP